MQLVMNAGADQLRVDFGVVAIVSHMQTGTAEVSSQEEEERRLGDKQR